MNTSQKHRAKLMLLQKQNVLIDVDIYNVVKLLNQIGVYTSSSCQSVPRSGMSCVRLVGPSEWACLVEYCILLNDHDFLNWLIKAFVNTSNRVYELYWIPGKTEYFESRLREVLTRVHRIKSKL